MNIHIPTAAKSFQSCPTLCDPIDGSPVTHQFSSSIHTREILGSAYQKTKTHIKILVPFHPHLRENSIETCILSTVKQITSPGWMHETSAGPGALGKPRGSGWRGRWEGGSGWGTHVTPWLIHVNIWQNPLQYCKAISLQLIKINGKKNLVPFIITHS